MQITLPLLFLSNSQVKNLFSIFVESYLGIVIFEQGSCLGVVIFDQGRKYCEAWGSGDGRKQWMGEDDDWNPHLPHSNM